MNTLNEDILKLLVCPDTKLALSYASDELVGQLNLLVDSQSLKFVSGQPVQEHLSALLVRSDDALGYGVFEDIPNLLANEGISLDKT